MLPVLEPVAKNYALGTYMLDRAVGDFLEADWAVRDAAGHDPRWIAGHLALYRQSGLAMLGLPRAEEPWMACFARGKSAADVPADLDMGKVLASFRAAGEAMAGGWDALTAEALAGPLGRTLPDGTSTLADGLRFLAWHETYHLGQLGLFRKLAGKAGVA
ncbi:MAG TPA: DinB family protein [Holophaga sp.]|nr:DinB family protein [Holophaga sp.]